MAHTSSQKTATVDPKARDDAAVMWNHFLKGAAIATSATVALLLVMTATLL